jgi:hypothetical protein
MLRSRWGVFAVKDHQGAATLIPEVLLYDRLIFPYPVGEERARWAAEGRDPDNLDKRLDLLGDLAEPVPWSLAYRGEWRAARDAIREDVADMEREERENLGYMLTRRVLAQGVRRSVSSLVDVVAAYPSRAALEADHFLGKAEDAAAACVALKYEFLTPASERDPEGVLRDAVALAKDATFRERRQEFYHWQGEYLAGTTGLSPEQAVEAMHEMAQKYSDAVKSAHTKFVKKTAFVVASAALSVTGALISMNPLPLVGTALSLVQFLTLDRKPTISAGRAAPAAMFHDAAEILDR